MIILTVRQILLFIVIQIFQSNKKPRTLAGRDWCKVSYGAENKADWDFHLFISYPLREQNSFR